MFEIGWGELVLIGIVALIAIGPKELPGALRALGFWMGKVRRMASEFQNQFQEAMREAEIADLKKEMDTMAAQAGGYTPFDPIAEAGKDIEKAVGEAPKLDTPASTPGTEVAEPAAVPSATPTAEPAPVKTDAGKGAA